jgi:hypothetical protein
MRELSLPAKVYLLACDVDRCRLRDRQRAAYLVRGAALTDLLLKGGLADEGGVVRAVCDARAATNDTVLDDLRSRVLEGRPRKWKAWVRADAGSTLREVERQLDAAGVISLREGRVVGVFPSRRPTVNAMLEFQRLHVLVDDTLRGDGVVSRIAPADAALTALVTAVELKGVVSGRDRRIYRLRIDELEDRGGAAVPALRKVFQGLRALRASATASASGG